MSTVSIRSVRVVLGVPPPQHQPHPTPTNPTTITDGSAASCASAKEALLQAAVAMIADVEEGQQQNASLPNKVPAPIHLSIEGEDDDGRRRSVASIRRTDPFDIPTVRSLLHRPKKKQHTRSSHPAGDTTISSTTGGSGSSGGNDDSGTDSVPFSVVQLHLRQCRLWSLDGIASMAAFASSLTSLLIAGAPVLSSLAPLEHSTTSLSILHLSACPLLTSLEPLRAHPALHSVTLISCEMLTSVAPLRDLAKLRTLRIVACLDVADPLGDLFSLGEGQEDGANGSSSSGHSSKPPLPHIETLSLRNCSQLTTLAPLAAWARALEKRCSSRPAPLRDLDLRGCSHVPSLEPLRGLTALERLDISDCRRVSSLEPLLDCQALTHLAMAWCPNITSLEPLLAPFRCPPSFGVQRVVQCGPVMGPLKGTKELRKLGVHFSPMTS